MKQGFVKDLLDVPDNLERAAASVPETALSAEGGEMDVEKLRVLLRGLLEGVRATERIMLQVTAGIVKQADRACE
jgi:molecular chaperone GrpE